MRAIPISLLLVACVAWPALGSESASCVPRSVEVPLESVDATAGVLANALKRDDSLRAVAERLLADATIAARQAAPPASVCPAVCPPAVPEVVLRSVPATFGEAGDEAEHCGALHESTSRQPLVWERSFDGVDALTNWINDFSRGRGDDGRDLYERCDGSCSPQYAWTIRESGAGAVAVRAEVVCGPPRDRGDDVYRVGSALLWSCGPS